MDKTKLLPFVSFLSSVYKESRLRQYRAKGTFGALQVCSSWDGRVELENGWMAVTRGMTRSDSNQETAVGMRFLVLIATKLFWLYWEGLLGAFSFGIPLAESDQRLGPVADSRARFKWPKLEHNDSKSPIEFSIGCRWCSLHLHFPGSIASQNQMSASRPQIFPRQNHSIRHWLVVLCQASEWRECRVSAMKHSTPWF